MRLIRSEQLGHSKTSVVLVALEVCASSGPSEPRAFDRVNGQLIWTATGTGKFFASPDSHSDRARLEMGAINRIAESRFAPKQKPKGSLAASGPLEQKI